MSPPHVAPELSSLPHIAIDKLEPFQGDLKDLSAREYEKLKKSIVENGIIVPFFVWKETGKLLDGHQRHHVFINEDWYTDVPVIYISAENEQDAKKKLLVITSQYGKVTQEGWDSFVFDLDENWLLDTVNIDALPFVFENWEPDELETNDAEPQISRADELQKEWGVELGQMWRLPSRTEGQEHRLICGDCTDSVVVERVMGGDVAGLGIHDPPYGVNMDKGFAGKAAFSGRGKLIPRRQYADDWDGKPPDDFGHLLGNYPVILWGGNNFADKLPVSSHWIVWDKHNTMPTYGDCELAWTNIGRKSIKKYDFEYNGLIGREKERFHPTQKPVKLFESILKDYCKNNGVVCDFYLGSGTTIVASENLGSQCRTVEIAPKYVAIALQRYKDAFGITPELIGYG